MTEKKPYMSFNPPIIGGKTPVPGLFYDFNLGARVKVPKGEYRVRLLDKTADLLLYDAPANNATISSTKRYFVNFRIEVYKKNKDKEELVFAHDYNAKGKKVLIKFPDTALGDVLAWFPYVEEFRNKHECDVYCAMAPRFSAILRAAYPKINFIGQEDVPENLYASYFMGIFHPWDGHKELQPYDWRIVGLQKHAAYILGVEPLEIQLQLKPSGKKRQIEEKYVCIATKATGQAKYWNNPIGWVDAIAHLQKLGYRVLCIDRDRTTVNGRYGNNIPFGAEDFTGNISLQDRIDLLYYADFFLGLPSGLSWLAWGVGKPVVMVSGFSAPNIEFYTPYRVQHYHVCNSCLNNAKLVFNYGDTANCPLHNGTAQEFECTRTITGGFVNNTIDRLLADRQRKNR
jgi:autotransporter strand-loop-strand O-heptosyltransferase